MINTILVDLQYGDCGKGRIADYLMQSNDVCVRYSGGPNTGTTVYINGNKIVLHHLPVGLLSNKPSYIASTCLVNPLKLLEEINYIKSLGYNVDNNLFISPFCFVITEKHIEIDKWKETTTNGVGSTQQGISPCSADKYSRTGIQLFESQYAHLFSKYFCDVSKKLHIEMNNHKNILFQSSQGTLLDIEHGVYPYLSTTSNTAQAAYYSCGIGIYTPFDTDVVGVIKPYVTYLGNNNKFITEVDDIRSRDWIIVNGHEYGSTTGRPRRIGWLDLPALDYACRLNGVEYVAITKVDILKEFEDYKVCVGYEDNKTFYNVKLKEEVKPIYKTFSKFEVSSLLEVIKDYIGIPVKLISHGRDRSSHMEELF
jgi:adenylosuccinate synthase